MIRLGRWGAPPPTRRGRAAAGLLFAASLVSPSAVRANGAFPSSGQILVTPGAPDRIGVRTTYGLVATDDGGGSWRWTCEGALGYGGDFHPQLAVAADGSIFGGLLDGMIRGQLGSCAWSRVPTLEGRRVVDVSRDVSGRVVAAVGPAAEGERAEVWASTDDASTWQRLGAPLPAKLQPLTLDTAPGGRVYVSGLLDVVPARGALAWSDDEGATWNLRSILDADASKAPYIGAVDPLDPEVVWVRLDAAPGELVVTRDGGTSWETVLVLEGFLRAFALSPDGSEVIAGGEVDGLLRAPADAPSFEPVAPIAARCAQWRDDAIDVCGTESLDGFTVARSVDGGATFTPLLVQGCVEGPEPCDPSTPVGACAAEWPAIRQQLGGSCGEGGAGTGGDGASSTTTGGGGDDAGATTGAPASSSVAASGTAGGDDSPGPGAGVPAGDGCGCRSTAGSHGGTMAAATLVLLAGSLWRSHRSSITRRTRRERR